ncbi:hydroxyectoine utilization dehydratase EutB [Guptibacillus hwajinpoensis]|uniref:hydroxyectoine utilization dehydratase EutB n=1 Tax=Guptibacillus hwajinpoensis TaxID=208199 RepID=UPI001CFC478A|nr:hydroxyectoine utilization dehydratase EutB [Pseudalkalibacillus hwajinpoensis]WLR58918.1 hydroxyectoine utilization dehydratase EutB [Pseudalkalibacillus hwajinpoensis]
MHMVTSHNRLQPKTITPPSLQDIWIAKKRIASFIKTTPLVQSERLSSVSDTAAYLKLENFQETGSFKLRGAANKILSLSEEERKKGVTTFSTGNHGLAVAYVARQLGVKAHICISNRVPINKVKKLSEMGAEVRQAGQNQDDAEAFSYELRDREGMTVIKPFDDPDVIAGQGTIALELLEELPNLDTCVIPLSGGGLLSGIALGLKATNPNIQVIGVSMKRAAVMYESIRANRPVIIPEETTLADSLLGGIGADNRYTFTMVRNYVDDIVLLSEEEIARGMSFLFRHHQIGVEGAAATAVSVLLHKKTRKIGLRTAALVSGSNVDVDRLLEIISAHKGDEIGC